MLYTMIDTIMLYTMTSKRKIDGAPSIVRNPPLIEAARRSLTGEVG